MDEETLKEILLDWEHLQKNSLPLLLLRQDISRAKGRQSGFQSDELARLTKIYDDDLAELTQDHREIVDYLRQFTGSAEFTLATDPPVTFRISLDDRSRLQIERMAE